MSPRLALSATVLVALGLCAVAWATPSRAATTSAPTPQGGGQNHHDLGSLRGVHGFTYSGTRIGVGPVASSGRIDFDGNGGLAATFTTSVAGKAFTGSFTGSYTVQTDGTGSVLVDLPWLSTQAHGNFVIVDHGDGTFFTSTDAGYSVTGTTQKM
jgi:hypothetical protein